MEQFFVDRCNDGALVCITGEDVRHLTKVLRLKTGDPVSLCDGHGEVCVGTISTVSDGEVLVQPGAWKPSKTEPAHHITLMQCLPKAGKMETIVQKCAELGISSVLPVLSARCVAVPTRDFEKKRQRYARIALEAAKQSKRGTVPTVLPLCKLGDLPLDDFDTVLLAYEDEREVSLRDCLRRGVGQRIGLIVGPEGGFTAEEAALLQSCGAAAVSLGPRILRTETAGPAMLAQVLYEVEP